MGEDIYNNFGETELVEISLLPRVSVACEFKGHYACKNVEMIMKSTTTNGFNFRTINSLIES